MTMITLAIIPLLIATALTTLTLVAWRRGVKQYNNERWDLERKDTQ